MCPQSSKRCVMGGYQPRRKIGPYPLDVSKRQHLVAFTILPLKTLPDEPRIMSVHPHVTEIWQVLWMCTWRGDKWSVSWERLRMATHKQFPLNNASEWAPVQAGSCDSSRDIVSPFQGRMWVRGQGQKDILKYTCQTRTAASHGKYESLMWTMDGHIHRKPSAILPNNLIPNLWN